MSSELYYRKTYFIFSDHELLNHSNISMSDIIMSCNGKQQ